MIKQWWQWLRDLLAANRERDQLDEQACRHDGDLDGPMCSQCAVFYNGV